MKKAINIALASFLLTAGLIKAAPAFAQETAVPETYTSLVRTADIDLRTEAGQRQLNHRLAAAAREVCGTASDVNLKGKNAVRKCRDETIAQAQSNREAVLAAASRGAVIAVTASR